MDTPHVWLIDLAEDRGGVASLDAVERTRAARFADPRARDRWTRAHVALRQILGLYLDIDAARVTMERGKFGKPRLVQRDAIALPITFSLTHAEDRALLAVGCGAPLGVDMERVRPFTEMDAVIAAQCSEGERAELAVLDPTERVAGFYRCWTRKEAVLKALGVGLSAPLVTLAVETAITHRPRVYSTPAGQPSPAAWALLDLLPGDDYVGALASVGTLSSVSQLRWAT